MERIKLLILTSSAVLLLTLPNVNSQQRPSQRPLCTSQLALVNYACGRLPTSVPPSLPSAILFSDGEHRHGHGHSHRHGHRHRHGGGHHESPVEKNCCRWLKDVDDECVCDLLVHLPSFLARPWHEYTVIVDGSCNVTYSCGGRVRP